jgi:beta-N-acetylhexosaminidase
VNVIEDIRPIGIVLFARNIASPEQTRDLVSSINELEAQPLIAVDLEGGAVNRLRSLWGDLPSAAAAARSGRAAVRALGKAAGAACRALGIQVDFAPVIDLGCEGGLIAGQERCLSDQPDRVIALARIFNESLSAWGITGCLKHFPGLGAVSVDTHDQLAVLSDGDLDLHCEVFGALSGEVPLVMVGHAASPQFGDPKRPTSLSIPAITAATKLPGSPVVVTDDLEMGALAGFGDLPELVVEAFRARIHGALVCSRLDRLSEIVNLMDATATTEPSLKSSIRAASARLGTLRREVRNVSSAIPAPDDETVAQLWELARRSVSPEPSSPSNAT